MRGDRDQLREIAGQVWPAAFSALLFALLEVADAAMLGTVGVREMAGALLGSTVVYLILVLPLQTLRAFTPIAAQRAGAGASLSGLRPLLLLSSLALGAGACLLAMAATAILGWLGYEPALLAAARTFLLWRAPFLPVELAFVGAWAMLEGLQGTRAPLAGGVAAVAVNLALNLLLIRGGLGLPALGVAGAALATNLATAAGLAVLWLRLRRALAAEARFAWPEVTLVRRFVAIGWPLGLAGLLESAGWLVIGLLIARAGAGAAAAHGILGQLVTLGLAIAQGTGVAAAVSVARALGRGSLERARRRGTQVLRAQLVIGLVLMVVVMAGGELWVGLFTRDVEVSTVAGPLLPLAAAILLAEGLTLTLHGILEGSGRTRVLLQATVLFDVGFILLALLRREPAPIEALYQGWLLKNILKLGFLLAWVERRRWRAALLALVPPPRAPVALRLAAARTPRRIRQFPHACWSAVPEPDS